MITLMLLAGLVIGAGGYFLWRVFRGVFMDWPG